MAEPNTARARRPLPISGVPDGVFLFDGVCVLCSASFRFTAARDPGLQFRFAQVQSGFGRELAVQLGIDPDQPQTIALICGGRAYFRSDAALRVLRRLPGWSWVGAFLLVPRPLRDWVYDRVAANRYRLFGRTETCMVPSAELRRHVFSEREGA